MYLIVNEGLLQKAVEWELLPVHSGRGDEGQAGGIAGCELPADGFQWASDCTHGSM